MASASAGGRCPPARSPTSWSGSRPDSRTRRCARSPPRSAAATATAQTKPVASWAGYHAQLDRQCSTAPRASSRTTRPERTEPDLSTQISSADEVLGQECGADDDHAEPGDPGYRAGGARSGVQDAVGGGADDHVDRRAGQRKDQAERGQLTSDRPGRRRRGELGQHRDEDEQTLRVQSTHPDALGDGGRRSARSLPRVLGADWIGAGSLGEAREGGGAEPYQVSAPDNSEHRQRDGTGGDQHPDAGGDHDRHDEVADHDPGGGRDDMTTQARADRERPVGAGHDDEQGGDGPEAEQRADGHEISLPAETLKWR